MPIHYVIYLILKRQLHQFAAGSQTPQDNNEVLTEGDEKDSHTNEEDMVA